MSMRVIGLLFDKRYNCRVPGIALKTNYEMQERGMYTTGDEEEDLFNHSSLRDSCLTVNRMFEIWKSGYPIALEKESDTLEIFNTITEHLETWIRYMRHAIHRVEPPFEDLLLLDKFADKVYQYAKYEREKRNINYFTTAVSAKGLGLSFTPLSNLFAAKDNNPKKTPPPARDSFTEELLYLGGTMSTDLREHQRGSIFRREYD